MNNSEFVHLHLHDQYSVLDGYGTAKQYAERAKEIGFTSLALTNHGNLDGCVIFQKACNENGIKPIFGCEAYIVEDLRVKEKGEKRKHISLLARNLEGWRNICKMLTIANINGFYRRARIDPDLLLDHCEGLAIGTACASSILTWPRGKGVDLIKRLRDKGCLVYFEIMPIDMDIQRDVNRKAVEWAEYLNIPLVATNDCHYVLKKHAKVQEVLLAIQQKAKWNDPKRWKFDIDSLYLQTVEEMEINFRKFGGIEEKYWRQ